MLSESMGQPNLYSLCSMNSPRNNHDAVKERKNVQDRGSPFKEDESSRAAAWGDTKRKAS